MFWLPAILICLFLYPTMHNAAAVGSLIQIIVTVVKGLHLMLQGLILGCIYLWGLLVNDPIVRQRMQDVYNHLLHAFQQAFLGIGWGFLMLPDHAHRLLFSGSGRRPPVKMPASGDAVLPKAEKMFLSDNASLKLRCVGTIRGGQRCKREGHPALNGSEGSALEWRCHQHVI